MDNRNRPDPNQLDLRLDQTKSNSTSKKEAAPASPPEPVSLTNFIPESNKIDLRQENDKDVTASTAKPARSIKPKTAGGFYTAIPGTMRLNSGPGFAHRRRRTLADASTVPTRPAEKIAIHEAPARTQRPEVKIADDSSLFATASAALLTGPLWLRWTVIGILLLQFLIFSILLTVVIRGADASLGDGPTNTPAVVQETSDETDEETESESEDEHEETKEDETNSSDPTPSNDNAAQSQPQQTKPTTPTHPAPNSPSDSSDGSRSAPASNSDESNDPSDNDGDEDNSSDPIFTDLTSCLLSGLSEAVCEELLTP